MKYIIKALGVNIFVPETNEVILAGETSTIPVPQEVIDRASQFETPRFEVVSEVLDQPQSSAAAIPAPAPVQDDNLTEEEN